MHIPGTDQDLPKQKEKGKKAGRQLSGLLLFWPRRSSREGMGCLGGNWGGGSELAPGPSMGPSSRHTPPRRPPRTILRFLPMPSPRASLPRASLYANEGYCCLYSHSSTDHYYNLGSQTLIEVSLIQQPLSVWNRSHRLGPCRIDDGDLQALGEMRTGMGLH